MRLEKRNLIRKGIIILSGGLLLAALIAVFAIVKTRGRTQLQIDIHQNKELIRLSNFAEPPQFAIWLENPLTKELKTVFVTHRVAAGDWEGKANVPVALPLWFKLFRGKKDSDNNRGTGGKTDMVITGATPKDDYFSIRIEVKPGSEWLCWIEMNLAGDFNDAYPEFDREALKEDEFSNGQPSLLFSTRVTAIENQTFTPVITSQSEWEEGEVKVKPVSEGITTARDVFDEMKISVIRPKPKLIDKNKIQNM
jgi:hypothetical protein